MFSNCSLFFLALGLGTISCAPLDNNEISNKKLTPEFVQSLVILKPQNEPSSREYKAIKLSNGLTVILVSDLSFKNVSVSLSVPSGQLHDPPEIPGLTHFLEYFMFEKKENRFQRWISENGGTTDSDTTNDYTNFAYSISLSKFNDSLNSFANQFTSPPILSESALETEIHNITSSYRKYLQNENWKFIRMVGLNISVHPFHNFTEGSFNNLNNLRNSLLKLYENYYFPNLMNLVIAGPQPLLQLQECVQKEFGSISNLKNKPKPIVTRTSPYQGNEIIKAKINSKMGPRLILEFPLDLAPFNYQRNAADYIISLLKKDGNGSLIGFLKTEKLASRILVSKWEYAKFSNLEVNIILKSLDMTKVNYVIDYFYQYLRMLKEVGQTEHGQLWNEFFEPKSKTAIFSNSSKPLDIATKLSGLMTTTSVYKILFADGSDPFPDGNSGQIFKGILTLLEKLTKPKNSRFFLSEEDCCGKAPTFLEPFYNIEYTRYKIDDNLFKKWASISTNSNFYLSEKPPISTQLKKPIVKKEEKKVTPTPSPKRKEDKHSDQGRTKSTNRKNTNTNHFGLRSVYYGMTRVGPGDFGENGGFGNNYGDSRYYGDIYGDNTQSGFPEGEEPPGNEFRFI